MKKKLLIIDDDNEVLRMLSMFFKMKDYEVTISNTGLKYDQIKNVKPDLVLLDVNLVGSEIMGNQICNELKSQTDTKDLPVLLVSGEEDLPKIAKDCRANGFISKPFDIHTLNATVNTYLQ